MTDRLGIRGANEIDVEFLASVQLLANEKRLSADEGWDAKRYKEYWRAQSLREIAGEVDDSTTYVIEFNSNPIGRLRIVRPGDEIFIGGIHIHPNCQRTGLGSRVVRSLIDEAHGQGLPLTLEVEKDNPDAKRLYTRLGFKVVADCEGHDRMELRVART